MATFVCEQCGKVLDLAPARIRCGRRYCSQSCKVQSARTRPTKGRTEIDCLQCGKSFLVPFAWLREGRRKFCGRTCRNRHHKQLTGEKSPRYGKRHTSEAKDKISATRMARGVAQSRENHPAWKGGRFVKDYVYLMIDILPEDRKAMARRMRPNQGYIAEHRLVMAMTIERPLGPKEVVHHKNGVKTDNRPENLTLMAWDQHSRKHRHVERQLAAALAEIERLKSLLATYQTNGSPVSR